MYTHCPACDRQYRIKAAQLTAANGLVRCGFCGEQFNALKQLSDKPVPVQATSVTSSQPVPAAKKIPAQNEKPLQVTRGTNKKQADDFEPEFDISDILAEETRPVMSRAAKITWSSGIFLLVITAVIQVGWFNRDYLLKQYPQLEPWLELVCSKLQCEVMQQYSTSSIKLLNRDVRLHPHYSDTLLVNATMANRSADIRPYPDVQFSLFDTDGRVIASRTFKPDEYLDNSINIKKGMPSNLPVHFVLEVTGPLSSAVSFEFRFL